MCAYLFNKYIFVWLGYLNSGTFFAANNNDNNSNGNNYKKKERKR